MNQFGATHLTENDTLPNSKQLVQRNQNIIFMVLVSTVHIELPYTLHGEFFLLQLDLVRVWCEFVGERANVVGEGC